METKQRPAHIPDGGVRHDVGELLHKITDDVKMITSDEVELVRDSLARSVKAAAAGATMVIFGGVLAMIGLGMLCLTAVAALAAVIPALWLRLLIMAVVYLAIGGLVAGVFVKRLKHGAAPDLEAPLEQAKLTIKNIEQGLKT